MFDRPFLQKIKNPFFNLKKKDFFSVAFMFLADITVLLSVLNILRSISALSSSFGEI